MSHKSLENNRVTSLNPVMLMVSDSAYDVLSPGYEGGLYCKWQVTGDAHLLVEFIDVNIYPVTENCDYDGLVILRNGTQEQLGKSSKIGKAHVFYASFSWLPHITWFASAITICMLLEPELPFFVSYTLLYEELLAKIRGPYRKLLT